MCTTPHETPALRHARLLDEMMTPATQQVTITDQAMCLQLILEARNAAENIGKPLLVQDADGWALIENPKTKAKIFIGYSGMFARVDARD